MNELAQTESENALPLSRRGAYLVFNAWNWSPIIHESHRINVCIPVINIAKVFEERVAPGRMKTMMLVINSDGSKETFHVADATLVEVSLQLQ